MSVCYAHLGVSMGMTLWVHILNGREIESDETDHSWMYRLHGPLDALCERDGVDKLSSFFDSTDLEHHMDDSDEEEDEEEPALDPETGWEWGIDDLRWLPAAAGLSTLRKLEGSIAAENSIGDLPTDRKHELIEEVRDCVAKLEPAAKLGQRFHFTVLM